MTVDAATGYVTAQRVSDGATLFTTTSLSFGQAANGSRPGAVSASLSLQLPGSNRLYGMGEHRTGVLDASGFSARLEDSQYYDKSRGADILLPYYAAYPLGVGLLWNLPSFGNASLGHDGLHTWTSSATENIDLWVTTTPAAASAAADPAQADPAAASPLALLLHNYVDAVGHAAPMPAYVAGFWHCKNRYRSADQLLDVARGFVSRGLPLDIITVDYMHWAEFGDWSFNPLCWPDPAGMVQELQDMGVELAVTFWPYVTPAGAYYQNFSAAGYFTTDLAGQPIAVETWAGDMHLVDETQAAARAAIYSAFRAGYGRHGIRTVWLDGSEPERATSYNFGQLRFQGGTDSEVGEAWIQQHVRAMSEGFAADGFAPDEFFLLPRSAWAGTSRYSAGVWSGVRGRLPSTHTRSFAFCAPSHTHSPPPPLPSLSHPQDIDSTFEELGKQVRVLQQMALSGQALWTNDGGGYANGNPDSPEFQELVVRWLQASAFFPIMRLHGQRLGGPPANECGATGGDNEPWTLAHTPEQYSALTAAMQLRSRLRDYTLALNRLTVASGLPMVRPMVLAFPGDAGVGGEDVEDQWMYGRDFLVGPVLQYQATSRSVYLPDLSALNATWVYYWNGTDCGSGGGRVSVNTTSLLDFPLFVRTPTAPPAPLLPLASLWSPSRADAVTCASAECYSNQAPQGGYSALYAEGRVWSSPEPVTLGGQQYAVQALSNFWSAQLTDNAVAQAGVPPSASYTDEVANCFVLTEAAPGTLPLVGYARVYNASHTDNYAAASAAGNAWAAQQGYSKLGVLGYVLPAA